jgi:hypothetical protein
VLNLLIASLLVVSLSTWGPVLSAWVALLRKLCCGRLAADFFDKSFFCTAVHLQVPAAIAFEESTQLLNAFKYK